MKRGGFVVVESVEKEKMAVVDFKVGAKELVEERGVEELGVGIVVEELVEERVIEELVEELLVVGQVMLISMI